MVADVNAEAARETATRIRNAGGQAVSDQCDVARWVDAEAAVKRARREFGRLDVTINCAGILRIESLLAMSESEWSEVLRVNLTGAFLLTKAAMTVMREQGHGAIVHIASRMAVRSMEGHGAYGASKAGILQLTQTAALEGASYGVRVNCVCPGFIDTPMTRTGQDDDPFAAWNRVCPLALCFAKRASDPCGEGPNSPDGAARSGDCGR
jgi:NAD(P)-dependent dehydrogenase (short-subunit alcohol dehydrogenase family)